MQHAQSVRPLVEKVAPDRRRKPRMPMVFTLAKLVSGLREMPCMVRNLSDSGMQVQLPVPPIVNARVVIEMQGLAARPARVRWARGRTAGLQFETPCNIVEVFEARRGASLSPRFRLEQMMALHLDDGVTSVVATEMSTDEARLRARHSLATGCPAVLDLGLAGLTARGTIGARVCDDYQFFFDKPFASVTLAQLLRSVDV